MSACGAGTCDGDVQCGHHRLQAENVYKWLDRADALPRLSRRERAAMNERIESAFVGRASENKEGRA